MVLRHPRQQLGMSEMSELVKAVCAVQAEVIRLEKAHENAFDKYNFTSVDDFKDALRPLLARNGLSIQMTEAGHDISEIERSSGKKTLVAKVAFDVNLRHASGEAEAPERVTIVLPYTGAQTTGAARSYVIKEWLKTKFLASSGDMNEEADLHGTSGYSGMVLSKKEATPIFNALQKEMREIALERNPASLMQWALDNREQLMSLPPDWRTHLRLAYEEELKSAKANELIDRQALHKNDGENHDRR